MSPPPTLTADEGRVLFEAIERHLPYHAAVGRARVHARRRSLFDELLTRLFAGALN